LKIGIVTEYYYPLLGGITENVHNTMIRLIEMGHEVKIITSKCCSRCRPATVDSHSLYSPNLIRVGHSVPIYSNGSFAHLTVGIGLRADLRKILEREKFDLLHIHSPLVPTLPLIALFEATCCVVGTFHTYFDRNLVYGVLKEVIQEKALSRLDGQIAVSKSCIEALSRTFKLNPRIIPNGVDTRRFSPNVPRLERFDQSKMNLFFLGRLDPRNGLSLMLRAFGIVKSEFPEVRLIIAGDGPLRSYYKAFIPRSLAGDIHLVGPILGQRARYYATCDVFCSPVEKASFGVTLLEAMASGKPIVATANRGYKELLGPGDGFLVPLGDPRAFARSILNLLRDEQLRTNMGLNGRIKALRYSWDNVAGEIAAYYEELLRR
jgi:phosphatidylinositol alpha-mannosyltransferase